MPRTSLEKSFAHESSIQRASNASWLISYSDVLLGFTALLRFLTDLRCWEPLSEGAKTEIRNGCEKSVSRKNMEIIKNFEIKNLTIKNSKSRKYIYRNKISR